MLNGKTKPTFNITDNEIELIDGLNKNRYQAIVLTHPLEDQPYKKLITEQLYTLVCHIDNPKTRLRSVNGITVRLEGTQSRTHFLMTFRQNLLEDVTFH